MDDTKDRFSFIPDRIAGLGELAYNLWWSWHPAARMLFKSWIARYGRSAGIIL